eukprot:6804935-Karenia_brevis.AAC.1
MFWMNCVADLDERLPEECQLTASYKRAMDRRSRRYVEGLGAQGLSKSARHVAMPHALDWDMAK